MILTKEKKPTPSADADNKKKATTVAKTQADHLQPTKGQLPGTKKQDSDSESSSDDEKGPPPTKPWSLQGIDTKEVKKEKEKVKPVVPSKEEEKAKRKAEEDSDSEESDENDNSNSTAKGPPSKRSAVPPTVKINQGASYHEKPMSGANLDAILNGFNFNDTKVDALTINEREVISTIKRTYSATLI